MSSLKGNKCCFLEKICNILLVFHIYCLYLLAVPTVHAWAIFTQTSLNPFPYFIFCKYRFVNCLQDILVIFLIKAVHQKLRKGPLEYHLSSQGRCPIKLGCFFFTSPQFKHSLIKNKNKTAWTSCKRSSSMVHEFKVLHFFLYPYFLDLGKQIIFSSL